MAPSAVDAYFMEMGKQTPSPVPSLSEDAGGWRVSDGFLCAFAWLAGFRGQRRRSRGKRKI